MPADPAAIWTRVQAELRASVTDTTYELWLAPLRPIGFEGDVLLVEAPGPSRGWVADRFSAVLDDAAVVVIGPGARIQLAGDGGRTERHRQAPVAPPPGAIRDELNPKFTFEQFVLGDGNRLAHAAALAVAEQPGAAYNPLFLYGPPGVGKTHLLHSIGNYVRAYGSGLTVRCTTAEAFTNDFLGALHRGGDVGSFKERFRGVDVLLIDDVQFLQSKARTEEEFFHTFNALHDSGSQLVLTSDRLPRDMAALEDRLRERFESGLVADIVSPDLVTRTTILRKRVNHDGVELADDSVLDVIARRIKGNVRALEGALIRVVAFHSLTGRPIDDALAEEVLDGLYPGGAFGRPRAARPTLDQIQRATCDVFGLTREELLSASRAARLAWPRQLAMYMARAHTGASLPAIGQAFGGRNHTTVMHACGKVEARLASDSDAVDAIRTLTERLHADRHD
jgi:chromosomal replication initiator protein